MIQLSMPLTGQTRHAFRHILDDLRYGVVELPETNDSEVETRRDALLRVEKAANAGDNTVTLTPDDVNLLADLLVAHANVLDDENAPLNDFYPLRLVIDALEQTGAHIIEDEGGAWYGITVQNAKASWVPFDQTLRTRIHIPNENVRQIQNTLENLFYYKPLHDEAKLSNQALYALRTDVLRARQWHVEHNDFTVWELPQTTVDALSALVDTSIALGTSAPRFAFLARPTDRLLQGLLHNAR